MTGKKEREGKMRPTQLTLQAINPLTSFDCYERFGCHLFHDSFKSAHSWGLLLYYSTFNMSYIDIKHSCSIPSINFRFGKHTNYNSILKIVLLRYILLLKSFQVLVSSKGFVKVLVTFQDFLRFCKFLESFYNFPTKRISERFQRFPVCGSLASEISLERFLTSVFQKSNLKHYQRKRPFSHLSKNKRIRNHQQGRCFWICLQYLSNLLC